MATQSDSPYGREPKSYSEMLGIQERVVGEGWARVRMPIRQRHLQSAGVVQGGIIVAIADTAFYRAVTSVIEKGQSGATVELKVNFIAPAQEGELTAECRIVHKGNRLVVGEMTVTDDKGTLIAKGLGTYTIFNRIRHDAPAP